MSHALGYVSLRISKPGMSAAEVTARLGLTPTYSHEVGDVFGRHGQRRSEATWTVSTRANGPGRLDDHLTLLLDLVEPKRSIITELANEGSSMDWFCFVSVEGQGGIALSVDLLRRLAGLPIQLDFDIYS